MSTNVMRSAEVERSAAWDVEKKEEQRWSVPRAAAVVTLASVGLWVGIFALVSWLV